MSESDLFQSVDGLIVEQSEGLLTVTIDRPQVANAITNDLMRHIASIANNLAAGSEPRALLLRTSGKHFCSGADLSQNRDRGKIDGKKKQKPATGHMVRSLDGAANLVISALWNCAVPVVVGARGHTAGIGLHLALTADLIVAADSAKFREPFIERGFNPDSGGSWLLSRKIGLSHATDMIFRSSAIDAATALSWGLINEVVTDDQLDSRALEVAMTLANGPTIALSQAKNQLRNNLSTELRTAMRSEAMGVELCIRSDDFKEGMVAFFEKRPPKFNGQ